MLRTFSVCSALDTKGSPTISSDLLHSYIHVSLRYTDIFEYSSRQDTTYSSKKKKKSSNCTLTSETYQSTSKTDSAIVFSNFVTLKSLLNGFLFFFLIVQTSSARNDEYDEDKVAGIIFRGKCRSKRDRTLELATLSEYVLSIICSMRGGGICWYSGAYPDAECGDLQYALDGEHPREAHVHVLQRVLVRVALPMELQCIH